MVYESSTRRIYSTRPVVSTTTYSYSVPSTRTYSYTISDPIPTTTTKKVESVTRTVRSSGDSYGPGGRSYTTTTESTTRDDGYGPSTSTYSIGPGGASYFSTASYKSPYIGNSFRHMSYR